MAGRFGTVKVKRSELLPVGELAEALGFTDPDDLLVVLVDEDVEDDVFLAPRESQAAFDPATDYLPLPGDDGISFPEIVDLRSDARDIYTRSALPASLADIEESRAAQRRQTLTEDQRLGVARLPEDGHNVTGWQIVLAARSLGAVAEILPSGDISIKSPFGSGVYTIPAACKAINARCFHPGAL